MPPLDEMATVPLNQMETDTSPVEQVLCARCGAPVPTPNKAALEADLMRVLEVAPSRLEAPNATICRAALNSKYGSTRARQIVDFLLKDKVVPATKAYHRRHLMFLNKQPLRLKHLPE